MKDRVSKRSYATVDSEWGGLDFRRIAERMTQDGDRMNHSTARNVFLSAMRTIAERVILLTGEVPTESNVKKIAAHPLFQQGVAEILRGET